MNDLKKQLRAYLEGTAPVSVEDIVQGRLQTADPALRRRHPVWVALAAAAAALLGVGIPVILLFGGTGDGDVADTSVATTIPTTVPATIPTTIVPGEWNPILSDTRARQAPPAALCPPGADSTQSGPSDQERPETITHSGLTAAFDRHAGRIVYVDAPGTTWTFDVCTNTWQQMDPVGTPYRDREDLFDMAGAPSGIIGDLVYDVDSDRTVMFSGDSVYVYEATTNTWTSNPSGLGSLPDLVGPIGFVYDPVSGLIVTTFAGVADDLWHIWAYDVDTGTWTAVGTIALDRTTPCCTQIDLLGYSPQLDRLILTTSREPPDENPFGREFEQLTLLLDPRTGTIELLPTPSPPVDIGWPSYSYGQAGGTVFVNGWAPGSLVGREWGRICGFDTGTLEWTLCFEAPPGLQARDYAAYAAMIEDPINQRLVLINGRYGDWWRETDAAVWAIDLRSGDTFTLIGPAEGR